MYVLALCRLAHDQGILVGDLNDVQRLALLTSIRTKRDEEFEKDWTKMVLTAAIEAENPERASELLKMLSDKADEGLAPPTTQEDIDQWVPYTEREETAALIDILQKTGVARLDS